MAVSFLLAFTVLVIVFNTQEGLCLQNDRISMNAFENVKNFNEKVQYLDDMHSEEYMLLHSIAANFHKNISFWNQVKTALNEFDFSNSTKNNSQCISDSLKLVTDALQFKGYTFQLLDAVGKLPPGVFQGHFVWYGDYQTCLQIKAQNDSFHGKYCTSSFYVPSLPAPLNTVPISVGICVPRSCDNDTVVDLLQMAMHFSPIGIYPVSTMCSEPKPFTAGDIAATVILSVIAFLVLLGTFIDAYCRIRENQIQDPQIVRTTGSTNTPDAPHHQEDNRSHSDTSALVNSDLLDSGLISPRAFDDRSMEISQEVNTLCDRAKSGCFRVMLAMSLITNGEKLLDPTQRNRDLSALNGIRVLSMSWVILGHTYVFTINLLDNPAQILKLPTRYSFQPIINGTLSVDSFFFLSGLLVAYLTLRELQKQDGKLNWLLFYFHRFWRLTPVYMLCLMFFMTLYTHTFVGPIDYGMNNAGGYNSCKTYWWTNLLYINNFIPDFADSCMAWAWYLANDMQFFIISPIFIILLYRFPKVGFSLLAAATSASVILTSVTAYQDDMQVLLTSVQANKTVAVDGNFYVRPYYRIPPYLVGMFTGYLIYRHRGYLRLPKVVVALGWIIAYGIGMSVVYGLYNNYRDNHEPSRGLAILYIGASRFAWSLALSWLAFACVCGYGEPINTFLSWSVWGPLGRLTYCVYLVHPMVMYWYILSQQNLLHLTDINMTYLFIGNIVMSYAVAFVVSLFLEAPMIQLEKLVFRRGEEKQVK